MKSDYGKKARIGSNEPYRSGHDNINWNKGDNMFKKILKIVGFVFYAVMASIGIQMILEMFTTNNTIIRLVSFFLIMPYIHKEVKDYFND